MSADAVAQLRSGSWAPGGSQAFVLPYTQPGGILASVISWAIEYIQPLKSWEEELRGNQSAALASAESWRTVSAELLSVQEQLETTDGRLDVLEGRAARALRKRFAELRENILFSSECAAAIAAAMELSSSIATTVHDGALGAINEIAGFADTLVNPFTYISYLNPFDSTDPIVDLVNHAMGFIEAVGAIIEGMFDAFEALISLIAALGPLISRAMTELADLAAEIAPGAGSGLGALLGLPFGPGGVVVGGGLGWLLGLGSSTLLQSDARVTELLPSGLDNNARQLYNEAMSVSELTSLSDFVQQNSYTDRLGGENQTVIDIKQVLTGYDAHGNPQYNYVVSLPSTQDWNVPGDQGAANDLGSNIALMLMNNPALRTQYERGVMQAMADAGVPPNANVVWTGFSQGGIMAANLASDSPYNTVGVITNGSPVTNFDLPGHVPVYAFEHATDPVAQIDTVLDPRGALETRLHPNHHIVTMPNPPQAAGVHDVGAVHNNDNYAESVRRWEQNLTPAQRAQYEEFLTTVGGDVVDHQMHRFDEG